MKIGFWKQIKDLINYKQFITPFKSIKNDIETKKMPEADVTSGRQASQRVAPANAAGSGSILDNVYSSLVDEGEVDCVIYHNINHPGTEIGELQLGAVEQFEAIRDHERDFENSENEEEAEEAHQE